MKLRHWLLAAALATPSIVLAQDEKKDEPATMDDTKTTTEKERETTQETTEPTEPPATTEPTAPTEPAAPTAPTATTEPTEPAAPTATTEPTEPKDTEQEAKDMVRVRSHVVPAVAGIEAADKAVAALFELSGDETLRPQEARRTLALAKQGIAMAIERTDALDKKTLSEEAKAEADNAGMKLREARTAITNLEKQIGKRNAPFSAEKIELIREQAKELHTNLSDAGNAVEVVAKAYDVPTNLEFEG